MTKIWVVTNDWQIPFHDEKVLDLVVSFIRDLKPHGVILNGDIIDCVSPETRILKYDLSWVPASEIVVGDKLIGFDEHGIGHTAIGRKKERFLRPTMVTGAVLIRQPAWKLILSSGEILTSSSGHQWLGWESKKIRSVRKWMSTENIAHRAIAGKVVSIHRPTRPWKTSNDWSNGYIRAAFEGEGHITFHSNANNFAHLGFTQKPGHFLDEVEKQLHHHGFETHRNIRKEDGIVALQVLGGMWEHARFIGTFRPPRFLDKWIEKAPINGYASRGYSDREVVVGAEYLGEQWVVSLRTSESTFIAEGFSSHNCYQFSEFSKDPLEKSDVVQEQRIVRHYMSRLSDIKEKWFLGGNHEDRLRRYIWNHAPKFAGLEEMTFTNLFHLKDHGFQWKEYGGYLYLGKLMVTHGSLVSKHSGQTGRAHMEKYGTSILVGHTHRLGVYYRRDVRGVHAAYENGCLCQLNPEYDQFPNWMQGFSVIHVDDDGLYNVQQIPILPGPVFYYGKDKIK